MTIDSISNYYNSDLYTIDEQYFDQLNDSLNSDQQSASANLDQLYNSSSISSANL